MDEEKQERIINLAIKIEGGKIPIKSIPKIIASLAQQLGLHPDVVKKELDGLTCLAT